MYRCSEPKQHLVVVQQRCALPIFIHNLTTRILSPIQFPAQRTRNRHSQRAKERDAEDDEGEDPLQSDDLDRELRNGQGQCQQSHGGAEGVVLECDEAESREDQEVPDEDVGHDASGKSMRVNHRRAVPEEGDKAPCEWAGDGRDMNQQRGGSMVEIEEQIVEEVDHKDEFALPEVAAGPEHDVCPDEEVVQDEVAADIRGGRGERAVGREKLAHIADLSDEKDDPVRH